MVAAAAAVNATVRHLVQVIRMVVELVEVKLVGLGRSLGVERGVSTVSFLSFLLVLWRPTYF